MRFAYIDCPEISDVYTLKSHSDSRGRQAISKPPTHLPLYIPLVAAFARSYFELWYATHRSDRQQVIGISMALFATTELLSWTNATLLRYQCTP